MTADPRASLAILVTALERHFNVASSRQDPDDPNVMAAAQDLADAFDDYDEALFLATEVATPLAVYDGPFDDDDEDDEDDEDDDDDDDEDDDEDDVDLVDTEDESPTAGIYAGLDSDEIDFDEDDEPEGPANGSGGDGAVKGPPAGR
jgi:hypothetical protein